MANKVTDFFGTDNRMAELKALGERLNYALASKDLYEYVKLTNRGYLPNRFGQSICGEAQKFLLDEDFKGAFQILIIVASPQHGKACEDNTPVLTTTGWKRHGDLAVGDYVYGVDGLPKLITHAQTSYLHDCVEVTLDSGDSFICAKEHEWVVECNRGRIFNGKRLQRQTEILEAQHIFDGYHVKSPAIKVTMPLQNEDLDLPIDPYLLGLWLGDGHSAGIRITSHIDDFKEISEQLIKRGHIVKVGNDNGNNKLISVGVTNRKRGSNYFLTALKANNLIQNKHIPPIYINASYEQRMELLEGLMDTDGSVTKDGCICEYSGINKTLVFQVYELVRSLGIKCSFKIGDAKLNGRVICKKYRVQFTPNKGQLIFRLVRKQNRINTKTKTDRNDKNLFFIKSAKECGRHSVKCITVDGGMYLVGNGFIPTHNSTNITGSAPAWLMGQRPEANIMLLSYGDDLALKFGSMNLQKTREWGNKLFGITLNDTRAVPCTNVNFSLLNQNGGIKSFGLTSGVTGSPAKYIFVDDPVKGIAEADSELQRNSVWNGWQANVKSRLAAKAKIVVILTRWHEDDLAGRIEAYENVYENVKVIRYPCICEDEATDPLHRKVGDSLSPELGKDKEWADHMFKSYMSDPSMGGRRTWDSLYQGRPNALAGNIIEVAWLKFWKPKGMSLPPVKLFSSNGEVVEFQAEEVPDYWDKEIQSWDFTFKDKKTSDFVCGGYLGRRKSCIYLLDAFHEVASFIKSIEAIKEMSRKHPKAIGKYVEDKANGTAIINSLRKELTGLIPIQANDDKVARLRAVTPVIQGGNLYLPHPMIAPWVKGLVAELLSFPNGKNDDWVDMISQALNQLMYQSTDTLKTDIPKGTWPFYELVSRGFKDTEIRKAYMNGTIKLYGLPDKYKSWREAR